MIEGIKSLQQIPGVLDVKIGTHNVHFYEVLAPPFSIVHHTQKVVVVQDYKDRSKGWTHIFTVTLVNPHSLERYSYSP